MSNNINANDAWVLTEKQLWAHFVAHPIHVSLGSGTVIERYTPDHMVRDPGAWECMSEFADELGDALLSVDEPEHELQHRIEEIEAYAAGLKSVLEDFRRVKGACLIEDDCDDDLFFLPGSPVKEDA